MYPISSLLRRTLMGTSTRPAAGTPKCASSMAGVFGAMMATRSRWPEAERAQAGG